MFDSDTATCISPLGDWSPWRESPGGGVDGGILQGDHCVFFCLCSLGKVSGVPGRPQFLSENFRAGSEL